MRFFRTNSPVFRKTDRECSFRASEQAENFPPDAGVVVGLDDDICGFLYCGNRILHRAAPACSPEHVRVVQSVSEGDALRSVQVELLAQRTQGISLSGAGVGTGVGAGVAAGVWTGIGVTAAVGAGVVTGVGIAAWVGVGGAVSVTVTTAPGAFLRNRLQPDSTPTNSARIRNRLKIRTEFFTLSSLFFPNSAGGSAAAHGIVLFGILYVIKQCNYYTSKSRLLP